MKRKVLRKISGFIISIVVLYFLFTRISPAEVFNNLKSVSLTFVIAAFLLNFLDLAAPSFRLMILAGSDQMRLDFFKAYRITLIAAFGNYVFPLRLGEVIKIFAISGGDHGLHITKIEAAGIVFIERVLDLVVVISFFFLSLLLNRDVVIGINYLLCFGLFLSLMIIMLFLIINQSDKLSRLVERFPTRSFLARGKDIFIRLIESFGRIRSEGKATGIIVYSVLYWLVVWFTYWFAFVAIGNPIGFRESFLIMTIGTLGLTIPSGPGGVGVLQGAFVVGGTLLGIQADIALAAGLFYQAAQAVFVLVFGFITYLGLNRSLN